MSEQLMKSLDRLVGALNELNDLDCGKVLGIGLAIAILGINPTDHDLRIRIIGNDNVESA